MSDPRLNEALEKEMCNLGFVEFICNLIIKTSGTEDKFEYILALTDFMDEGHEIV